MKRAALSAAAVAAAVLLQLTLVDRVPLHGGEPDLVLLVVVALGLTGGPVAGALTGFWAGLALDVAPPAGYLIGEHALVFCLVGYGCGQLRGMTDRSAASSLAVAATAVAGGEVLQVIIGLMFGDPGVSWPAIRAVLPSSVLQDVLLSPFVVYLIMRANSWPAAGRLGVAAAAGPAAGPLAGLPGAGRGGPADGAAAGAARWLAGLADPVRGRKAGAAGPVRGRKAGAVGSVRFGKDAARQGDGWVGSGPRSWRAVRGRVRGGGRPRLRPGAGQAGSATAGQPQRRRPGRPVSIRMGSARRGGGRGGGRVGAAIGAGLPGQRALGSAGLGSAGLGSAGLGSAGLGSAGLGRTGLRSIRRGSTRRGSTRLGGIWRGSARRGSTRLGGIWRGSARRGSIRLGSISRGSARRGIFGGGLAGGSASRPVLRPASPRSAPRFRRRAAAGLSLATRRSASWAPRQPRLRIGRRSLLSRMTPLKAAGRPARRRTGRRRTGGFS